jgi:hypothetical protein
MRKQLATLLLVGFSGVAFAQGAQQPPSQSGAQQPRQQQGSQQSGATQQPRQQQGAQQGAQGAVPSFDTADKNKDGQLSRAEASDLTGFDFSKADVNQNASIDRQEYTAAMSSSGSSTPAPRSQESAPPRSQEPVR